MEKSLRVLSNRKVKSIASNMLCARCARMVDQPTSEDRRIAGESFQGSGESIDPAQSLAIGSGISGGIFRAGTPGRAQRLESVPARPPELGIVRKQGSIAHPLRRFVPADVRHRRHFGGFQPQPGDQDLRVAPVAFQTVRAAASAQMRNSESSGSPNFLGECLGDIGHGLRAFPQIPRSARPIHRAPAEPGRASAARASRALVSCLRVTVCVRRVSATCAERFAQQMDRIPDSSKHASSRDGSWISSRQPLPRASKCPARFPLSTEEMYLGSSGTQGARVVPVVEMAAKQFQLAHGVERGFEALHGIRTCRSSRDRARRASREDKARYWWAKCDGPRPVWDLPENCPAARQ